MNSGKHDNSNNNMRWVLMLLVSLLYTLPLNNAFSPHYMASLSRRHASCSGRRISNTRVRRDAVRLFASDPEKEPEKSDDDDAQTPGQILKQGIYLFFSYCSTFIGVALTGGIVLNLCGYGYVVSRETGLRIDTIDKLREENQFRRVSTQYAREYAASEGMVTRSETQPPSSLPR
jgi:hypothetical protein